MKNSPELLPQTGRPISNRPTDHACGCEPACGETRCRCKGSAQDQRSSAITEERLRIQEEPTRAEELTDCDEQPSQSAPRRAGMVLTGVSTGPHRLRLPPGVVTYFAPPPPPSKLRPWLIAAVVVLVGCFVGAVQLVGCKRSASTPIASGAEQALTLYAEAKRLTGPDQRYAAMERLKRAEALTTDEEILGLVRSLEERLQADIQVDQARVLIKAGKHKEAVFHLQRSLALHVNPEAEQLLRLANVALAAEPVAKK